MLWDGSSFKLQGPCRGGGKAVVFWSIRMFTMICSQPTKSSTLHETKNLATCIVQKKPTKEILKCIKHDPLTTLADKYRIRLESYLQKDGITTPECQTQKKSTYAERGTQIPMCTKTIRFSNDTSLAVSTAAVLSAAAACAKSTTGRLNISL